VTDAGPLLATHALEVGHGANALLPPTDLEIGRGTFWSIIGPNGAGKSTFVRTLLGLQRPVRGTVTRAPDLRAAYVPQQSALDPIFPIHVSDFVMMGRLEPGRMIGPPSRDDRVAAARALDLVNGADLPHRLLRDLSGGQRQRVLIARAIASEANLYILDEPTAALDLQSERDILALISTLHADARAGVIMITHLIEDGLARADRALLLDRDHAIALHGPTATIAAAPELRRITGAAAHVPLVSP